MKRIIAIFAIMMAGYPVLAQSDSSYRSQKSLDEIQLDAVKRLHDQPVTDDGIGKQRTMPTPEQQTTDQSKEQITSKAKEQVTTEEQVTTDQLTMINSQDGMNRSQSYEGYRSPYFTFSNVGVPKDVDKLGTNPEFPFLQHKTSASQVYEAIKTNAGRDDHQMSEFNNILTAIGFANGARDVRMGDVTAANIPNGTVGNMGDGSYNSTYSKLNLGDEGVKAWKVTGSSGYVYFLAKCGNAFYPNDKKGTACINTPVSVTVQPQEIIAAGQKNEVIDRTYVYYHMRKQHRHPKYLNSAIPDGNPSKPLMLNATAKVDLVPETYRVTVVNPEKNITVCPDSAATVNADINIEKISGYSGFYPGKPNDQYKLVKKHVYMKAERKMRKVEKKENKVSKITRTPVEANVEAPTKA